MAIVFFAAGSLLGNFNFDTGRLDIKGGSVYAQTAPGDQSCAPDDLACLVSCDSYAPGSNGAGQCVNPDSYKYLPSYRWINWRSFYHRDVGLLDIQGWLSQAQLGMGELALLIPFVIVSVINICVKLYTSKYFVAAVSQLVDKITASMYLAVSATTGKDQNAGQAGRAVTGTATTVSVIGLVFIIGIIYVSVSALFGSANSKVRRIGIGKSFLRMLGPAFLLVILGSGAVTNTAIANGEITKDAASSRISRISPGTLITAADGINSYLSAPVTSIFNRLSATTDQSINTGPCAEYEQALRRIFQISNGGSSTMDNTQISEDGTTTTPTAGSMGKNAALAVAWDRLISTTYLPIMKEASVGSNPSADRFYCILADQTAPGITGTERAEIWATVARGTAGYQTWKDNLSVGGGGNLNYLDVNYKWPQASLGSGYNDVVVRRLLASTTDPTSNLITLPTATPVNIDQDEPTLPKTLRVLFPDYESQVNRTDKRPPVSSDITWGGVGPNTRAAMKFKLAPDTWPLAATGGAPAPAVPGDGWGTWVDPSTHSVFSNPKTNFACVDGAPAVTDEASTPLWDDLGAIQSINCIDTPLEVFGWVSKNYSQTATPNIASTSEWNYVDYAAWVEAISIAASNAATSNSLVSGITPVSLVYQGVVVAGMYGPGHAELTMAQSVTLADQMEASNLPLGKGYGWVVAMGNAVAEKLAADKGYSLEQSREVVFSAIFGGSRGMPNEEAQRRQAMWFGACRPDGAVGTEWTNVGVRESEPLDSVSVKLYGDNASTIYIGDGQSRQRERLGPYTGAKFRLKFPLEVSSGGVVGYNDNQNTALPRLSSVTTLADTWDGSSMGSLGTGLCYYTLYGSLTGDVKSGLGFNDNVDSVKSPMFPIDFYLGKDNFTLFSYYNSGDAFADRECAPQGSTGIIPNKLLPTMWAGAAGCKVIESGQNTVDAAIPKIDFDLTIPGLISGDYRQGFGTECEWGRDAYFKTWCDTPSDYFNTFIGDQALNSLMAVVLLVITLMMVLMFVGPFLMAAILSYFLLISIWVVGIPIMILAMIPAAWTSALLMRLVKGTLMPIFANWGFVVVVALFFTMAGMFTNFFVLVQDTVGNGFMRSFFVVLPIGMATVAGKWVMTKVNMDMSSIGNIATASAGSPVRSDNGRSWNARAIQGINAGVSLATLKQVMQGRKQAAAQRQSQAAPVGMNQARRGSSTAGKLTPGAGASGGITAPGDGQNSGAAEAAYAAAEKKRQQSQTSDRSADLNDPKSKKGVLKDPSGIDPFKQLKPPTKEDAENYNKGNSNSKRLLSKKQQVDNGQDPSSPSSEEMAKLTKLQDKLEKAQRPRTPSQQAARKALKYGLGSMAFGAAAASGLAIPAAAGYMAQKAVRKGTHLDERIAQHGQRKLQGKIDTINAKYAPTQEDIQKAENLQKDIEDIMSSSGGQFSRRDVLRIAEKHGDLESPEAQADMQRLLARSELYAEARKVANDMGLDPNDVISVFEDHVGVDRQQRISDLIKDSRVQAQAQANEDSSPSNWNN